MLLFFCFIVFSAAAFAKSIANPPRVDLGYAKYEGFTNQTTNVNYFLGIHYAEAPVGDLRWAKPVPIEKNQTFSRIARKSYQNATVYPDTCIQGRPSWNKATPPTGSEDCLILNIMSPVNAKKLPVLVNIHGGGYVSTSAGIDGAYLLSESQNSMVFVSLQYRLGMFGFLGGSDIKNHGTLNAGLLDQRLALEWVKKYIEKFGGDPDKITITGGSAGGGSVALQLTAYGGKGKAPFVGAYAEFPWMTPFLLESTQELQYKAVLDLAGCKDIKCLRSLDDEKIRTVSNASYFAGATLPQSDRGTYYYGPVIDGEFVTQLVSESFKKGDFHDVPLMLDHAPYEGSSFSTSDLKTAAGLNNSYKDAQQLFPNAHLDFFTELFELYPPSAYNSTFYQRGDWFGDFMIDCPTKNMAVGASTFNSNSSAVFKLLFAQGTQIHNAPAPFIYTRYLPIAAPNLTVAKILTSYVYSFVITGDPNILRTSEAPFWPSYSAVEDGTPFNPMSYSTLHITYGGIEVIKDLDHGAKCDFFAANSHIIQN